MPKEIRDRLHLEAGDKIAFYIGLDGRVTLVAKNRSLSDIAGMLVPEDTRLRTIDEIDEGIADAAAESGMAGTDWKPRNPTLLEAD